MTAGRKRRTDWPASNDSSRTVGLQPVVALSYRLHVADVAVNASVAGTLHAVARTKGRRDRWPFGRIST